MLPSSTHNLVVRDLPLYCQKKSLRLVSDMPDSNRNWKGKYFFIKGTDWVCRPEEWDTMPNGFDNTWGIIKDSGLILSMFSLLLSTFSSVLMSSSFFFISASIRPSISNEQEAFIQRVIKIPFEQHKCRDLITLDTLHAYCGGPKPTLAARRINTYSRRREYNFLCRLCSFFVYYFF